MKPQENNIMHRITFTDYAGHPQDLSVMIPPQKITVIRPEDNVEMELNVLSIKSISKAKIEVEKSEKQKI